MHHSKLKRYVGKMVEVTLWDHSSGAGDDNMGLCLARARGRVLALRKERASPTRWALVLTTWDTGTEAFDVHNREWLAIETSAIDSIRVFK